MSIYDYHSGNRRRKRCRCDSCQNKNSDEVCIILNSSTGVIGPTGPIGESGLLTDFGVGATSSSSFPLTLTRTNSPQALATVSADVPSATDTVRLTASVYSQTFSSSVLSSPLIGNVVVYTISRTSPNATIRTSWRHRF